MSELKAEAAKAAKSANDLLWDVLATIGGALVIIVIARILIPNAVPFSGDIPAVAGGIAGAIIWRRARRDN